MSDITMCKASCPQSKRCKRHEDSGTKLNKLCQAYDFSLIGSKNCKYFWEKPKSTTKNYTVKARRRRADIFNCLPK